MSNIDNLRLDAAEFYRLIELTERRRVKDILSIEAKKIETEITRVQQKGDGVDPSSSSSKNASSGRRTGAYDVKLNTYAWDQNDTMVKVYVTIPNVETLPTEKIHCSFKETSFELRVDELDGKNYVLSIGNLNDSVKVEKCAWRVKPGTVILTLPKANPKPWADLKVIESQTSKKPPKLDETGDPYSGIMGLMQQMYNDGDDEMKRTISKAWYESREKNKNFEM